MDWTQSNTQGGPMMYDSRNSRKIFTCEEMLCIMEFENENDLITHVASGTHKYANVASGMDKAMLYYIKQKNIQSVSSEVASIDYINQETSKKIAFFKYFVQGWARKIRQVNRLSEKQTQYISQLFTNGESTKIKLSAEQMHQRMKHEMVGSDYYFRPDEYLEPKQIRGLISRLRIKIRNEVVEQLTEDTGIENYIDDICDSVLDIEDEGEEEV
jgi:hypothetical protein